MQTLELLFERDELPRHKLPEALSVIYGGDFGVRRPTVYANFVASVDGVVALAVPEESGALISEHDSADQFVMGLLRASADAVLIGAGTFRKARGDWWYPEAVYPQAAEAFAQLRRELGLRPHPLLVVVTASGRIDVTQPALRDSLVVTTREGEALLRGALPSGADLVALDTGVIDCRSLLALLHARGLDVILTEGGPSLVGELLQQGLINEFFLTLSPKLFGRYPEDGRKSLIEGVDLAGRELALASVRRRGSYLYLRYGEQIRLPRALQSTP